MRKSRRVKKKKGRPPLPDDQWASRYDNCLSCETMDKTQASTRHEAGGLCKRCYCRLAARRRKRLRGG